MQKAVRSAGLVRALGTACRAGPSTRRLWSSVLSSSSSSSHTIATAAGVQLHSKRWCSSGGGKASDDSDFVDIDDLQAMAFFAAGGEEAPTLGVTRRADSSGDGDEEKPLSRLHLPMESEDTFARPNTRAALSASEERQAVAEHLSDTAAVLGASPSPRDALEEQAGANAEREELPYDDARFAETLLQMEVDGAIDEAWQDSSRKAQLEDVKELAAILRAMKVRDICCIDVSAKTSNFDYMLFGTCEGARHLHLAAWAAQDADRYGASSKIRRQQTDELWEVVPIGRIVLNLMVESYREGVSLERKWAITSSMDPLAAANAPVSEGRQSRAHGLWTLTLNLQDLEDFEADYCKDVLIRQL